MKNNFYRETQELLGKVINEEKQEDNDLESIVLKFFETNEEFDDDKIHSYAEKQGIDTHEFETMIYKVLKKSLDGGFLKHANDPDDKFDKGELERGIKIEMEHTDNPKLAKAVTKAHLVEIPDYNTRLDKMELEAKKKKVIEKRN